MGVSKFGIFHTLVGVVANIAALAAFVRYRKIDLAHATSSTYFYGTIVTSVTESSMSMHGGFNVGHVFSLY